jgi:hypothetical protein
MEEHQVGWIAAIVIGGIAGWLAEQFMKSQMGLLMNIVLGIVGPLSLVGCSASSVLDRLSDCRLHRSLHPNRDRPRVQRRSSAANMKPLGQRHDKRAIKERRGLGPARLFPS